jgi:hypothetical protein
MTRRDNAPAISFFSFQDIITTVTGVMFLVVFLQLLVIFESRAERSAAPAGREQEMPVSPDVEEYMPDWDDLTTQWRLLQQENARLRREIQDLPEMESSNRIPRSFQIRLEVPEYAGRGLLLAEITSGTIFLREYCSGKEETFSGIGDFAAWAAQQDFTGKHLVLLFRPSAFGLYRPLLKSLDGIPVRKGIEILPDEHTGLQKEARNAEL